MNLELKRCWDSHPRHIACTFVGPENVVYQTINLIYTTVHRTQLIIIVIKEGGSVSVSTVSDKDHNRNNGNTRTTTTICTDDTKVTSQVVKVQWVGLWGVAICTAVDIIINGYEREERKKEIKTKGN